MYKNRSRGLKRASSVLAPATSVSTSNSVSDIKGKEQEQTSREPLREREPVNITARASQARNKDVEAPPAKKAATEKSVSKEDKSVSHKSQPSRPVKRSKPSKSSLLNNYVDMDVNTMYMTFPSKFEELVTKSGFKLQTDDKFLLNKDQALFVRNLTILLGEKDEYVEQFVEGLEKFMEDNDNFRKMLLDTETDPDFKDARSSVQDSLVRMLLCVDVLQQRVISLLLDKMATLIQRDEGELRRDKTPWVELIVKRLCFLDQLVDGTSLYTEIFRLLDMAPVPVQQEIIYNLPYIMGDSHHEEVAARLMKLMDTKQDLTPAVLEALGHLPLSVDQSAQVRAKMMQLMKRVRVEFLPTIVKFVSVDTQSSLHDEVINGLRTGLPFTRAGDRLLLQGDHVSQQASGSSRTQSRQNRCVSVADLSSSKAITFRNLRGAFLSIPSLAAAWLKNIKSIYSAKEHRPIDVIMLLMMHSKASNKRKLVEKVWRDRVRTGMFTDSLLEETFEVLLEVLKRHKDDVLNVAAVLLRSPEPPVRDFGSAMYCLAFQHFESHMQRQVVSDLVMHIGSEGTHAHSALDVLLLLADTDLDKLARHTIHLQNLLDNLDQLNLYGVRRMMDLLCRLAYAPEVQELMGSVGNLGDSISILVHKQLGSFEPLIKRKGVVSAVMMLKHMARSSSDASDLSLENSSLESLPPGRAKDATQLLDLVVRSTRSMAEALGYCLDQLSFMILRSSSLDPLFLNHVVEQMEEMFMASYIPDDEAEDLNSTRILEIRMEAQYGLDKDTEDPIVLGIGALVLKEGRSSARDGGGRVNIENNYPMIVLNPLFRLLRVLKTCTGDSDLENIDALLGCAINMPAYEMIVDFSSFGPSQQGDILDSLFYCINWFREIINAFAGSKSSVYSEKVKIRLRNVVALQATLARLLSSTLHYTPPQCMFNCKAKRVHIKPPSDKPKPKGRPKGKKMGKKKVNDSQMINDSTLSGQATEDQDKEEEELEPHKEDEQNVSVKLSHFKDFFRELDLEVFQLIQSDLIMTPPPEKGADTTPDFGPAELRFLLEDYVAKLEHALPSGAANRWAWRRPGAGGDKDGNFATFDLIPIAEKAANAVSMLPILCEKLEQLGETCRNLLEASDGIFDGPGMFLGNTADVKICFGLLLQAMSATFAWNGFQSVHHAELLCKGLQVLATRLDDSVARRSLPALVEEAAGYLQRFHKWTLHLDAAVYLVKLIQVLGVLWELDASRTTTRKNRIDPTKSVLREVCHSFLSRPWSTLKGDVEKGSAYTSQVNVLAEVYFDSVEDKLEVLKDLVPQICTEAKDLAHKDSPLERYPAVSKYNFYVLYNVIYSSLVKGVEIELKKDDSSAHQIEVWKNVFKILESLVDVTQVYSARIYLKTLLKYSQVLLKLFLDKAMPVLEWSLRSEPDDVMAILKSSQVTTRFVNKVCLSCKNTQDSTLMSYVPKVRETMETLVYRVKGMLALNNVQSAWNIGNLRNRDIHNVELCTQESNEDDESELAEAEDGGDADVTALDSDSEEESRPTRRRSSAPKQKSQGKRGKASRHRRSHSESEDEVENEGSEDGTDLNGDEDEGETNGDSTSVSEAY